MPHVRNEAAMAFVLIAVIIGLLTVIAAMRALPGTYRPAPIPADLQPERPAADDPRELLLARIQRQGDPSDAACPPIAVSVADFFQGNGDANSIGRGLSPHPSLEKFRQVLAKISQRQNVQAVLVGIKEVNAEDPNAWPVSTNVYILAWASQDSVARWLAELKPEQVSEGYPISGKPPAAPNLMEDAKVFTAWWE